MSSIVDQGKSLADKMVGAGGGDVNTGATPQQQGATNTQLNTLGDQNSEIMKQLGQIDLLQPGLLASLGVTKASDGTYTVGGNPLSNGLKSSVDAGNALTKQQFGDIMAGDPEQQQINSLLRQRQIAALGGNAPSDPTLEHNLQIQEQELRQKLQAQLGGGYETSTPGMQALADFKTSANEQRFNANQSLLTNAAGINNANTNNSLNAGVSGLQPTSLANTVQNSNFSNIFSTLNSGSPYTAMLGANAGGYNGPIGSIFANTNLGVQGRIADEQTRAQHGHNIMGIF